MYNLNRYKPETLKDFISYYYKDLVLMRSHSGLLKDGVDGGSNLGGGLFMFIDNVSSDCVKIIFHFKGQKIFKFLFVKYQGSKEDNVYINSFIDKKTSNEIYSARIDVLNLSITDDYISNDIYSMSELDQIVPKILNKVLIKFEIRYKEYLSRIELANLEKTRQENIVKERYKNLKNDLINHLNV